MKPPTTLLALCGMLLAAASAFADTFTVSGDFSGANENPANASPGTGWAVLVYDNTAHTLHVRASFSGLMTNSTNAHIHGPVLTPGGNANVMTQVPTFVGFPSGVTSGYYENTFNLLLASFYNPSFVSANNDVVGAYAAFTSALLDGRTYFNIHTVGIPSGELRANLTVPDSGLTALLLAPGLLALAIAARRRPTADIC